MQAIDLKAAFDAKATPRHIEAAYAPFTRWGAARVYVVIEGKDHVKAIKKAGVELRKAYGVSTQSNAFYVGYQNFDGAIPGRALAIVEALKALGVAASVEGQGD